MVNVLSIRIVLLVGYYCVHRCFVLSMTAILCFSAFVYLSGEAQKRHRSCSAFGILCSLEWQTVWYRTSFFLNSFSSSLFWASISSVDFLFIFLSSSYVSRIDYRRFYPRKRGVWLTKNRRIFECGITLIGAVLLSPPCPFRFIASFAFVVRTALPPAQNADAS